MIAFTKQYMEDGRDNICEASFNYNGLYCAIDILRKYNDGWAIYEVKSSTHEDNYIYIVDVAYQKYVLEKCGIKVTGTYLVNINSDYVFDGILKLDELFKITDVFKFVLQEQKEVEGEIKMAEKLLASEQEPKIDISCNCNSPYKCGFWKYCSKHLPKPSVFDLYRLNFSKKIEYYNHGIISFDDLEKTGWFLGDIRNRQIEYALHTIKGFMLIKKISKSF